MSQQTVKLYRRENNGKKYTYQYEYDNYPDARDRYDKLILDEADFRACVDGKSIVSINCEILGEDIKKVEIKSTQKY